MSKRHPLEIEDGGAILRQRRKSMDLIQPFGTFFERSPDGVIVNPCPRTVLESPWSTMVEALVAAYLELAARRVHSIYLRGSVARGTAIPGCSDLDSFAVLKPGSACPEQQEIERVRIGLMDRFSVVTDVELAFYSHEQVVPGRSIYAMMVKTQSRCVHGESLDALIAPFRIDSEAIDQLFHLKDKIRAFQEDAEYEGDADKRRGLCVWMMKGLIRSGFELVMEMEQVYTRDLYPCYEVFSRHFPSQERSMRQALAWAVAPTADLVTVAPLVVSLGSWLCDRSAERYPQQVP